MARPILLDLKFGQILFFSGEECRKLALFFRLHKATATVALFTHDYNEGRGGITQECFSNFSNNRFFSSREITGKTLSARKNVIGSITSGFLLEKNLRGGGALFKNSGGCPPVKKRGGQLFFNGANIKYC